MLVLLLLTYHTLTNTWVRSLALTRISFLCVQDRTSEPDKCGVHHRAVEYK